ncbi:MAG: cyclic pyranopterin monophosphate synthase MoaC, partial [Candidatus Altarchaeaceae archaeon]
MVDISEKKEIFRFARVKGSIKLRKETIEKIKNKEIEKGDVFQVAEIA